MINRDCPVFCMVRIPLLSTHFKLCCVPHAYSVHTEFTVTSMAYTPSQVSKQTPWEIVCASMHVLLVAVPFALKKAHVQEFSLSTYLNIVVCIKGCHWGCTGKGGQVMQECHRLPFVRWVFQYLIQSKIYVFIFPFSTGSGGSPSPLGFFLHIISSSHVFFAVWGVLSYIGEKLMEGPVICRLLRFLVWLWFAPLSS